MTMNTKLTGHDAINYAEAHGLMLIKSADAIEGNRYGMSIDEAREIAEQDPSLIHCYVLGERYYKIQGHGKKSIRGNRYKRYTIDRYNQLDGKMVFAETVAWHYDTNAEAEADLLRIKAEDEARGYLVEVL
jgi:hypothetical protein